MALTWADADRSGVSRGWLNDPMSDAKPQDRPRQLTMASWFVILGSVFLVASVYDSLTNLSSVDMRDEIGRVLDSGSGAGLGIGVDQALSIMRVALMVAGACAAAAAVLGVYVLQRHRGARVALSVVAVPLLLTAPFTGGLFGALVAAATLTLWTGPARDWFAGRPVRETPRQVAERRAGEAQERRTATPPAAQPPRLDAPSTPAPPAPSTASPSSAPGATQGFGRTEQQLPSAPPAWTPQQTGQLPGSVPGPLGTARARRTPSGADAGQGRLPAHLGLLRRAHRPLRPRGADARRGARPPARRDP